MYTKRIYIHKKNYNDELNILKNTLIYYMYIIYIIQKINCNKVIVQLHEFKIFQLLEFMYLLILYNNNYK